MTKHSHERKWWHAIEENLLVLILATMTALTFVNVVLRNWYSSSIVWGLEATSFLFAWLVILGLGYLVRTHAHLGVDVIVNLMRPSLRRVTGLIVAVLCILYALLLVKGAYDFSANFYNLPGTEGRVFPIGFEEMKPFKLRGYTPVVDIPMPDWLRPIWEPIFLGEGEPPYNKLPINIPYAALFLGMVWMLVRFIIAFFEIWRGVTDRLIVSHEVEDVLNEMSKEG